MDLEEQVEMAENRKNSSRRQNQSNQSLACIRWEGPLIEWRVVHCSMGDKACCYWNVIL